jgi:hypothetical protein
MSKPAMQPNEISGVLNRPISQELLARDVTRLGYVAKDGTPRTIPIGFTWNGAEIVMCTTKNAPKLTALRHNPAVALTIDTEVHPPKILLIRAVRARGRPESASACEGASKPRARDVRGHGPGQPRHAGRRGPGPG